MQLLIVILRTVFFYFFITFAYRIMGKREVGQLGIVDLIVSILIAELVAISIENYQDPMYLTIVPIILLVIMEIFLAFITLKNRYIRTVIDGKPSLIIKNGKISFKEMIKQRYSLDDLLLALRQKEINDIKEVEYAILEKNGKLSIFKYDNNKNYPLPIIIDGEVDMSSLKDINKNLSWLNNILLNNNLLIDNVFYAFYKDNEVYFIKKDRC
jgi:uncharacterized membrane protein YcaP (DUF421 family)